MKSFFDLLGKLIDLIEKICLAGSVVSVIAMMLLITTDVIGRKFFHQPIKGSVEITEDYLMIALVYLAMSYVYTEGGHVRVILFRRFIPNFIKLPLDTVLNLLGLLFFVLLAWRGWATTLRAIQYREFSSCILAYPLAPAYFILTLGAALLCVRILETIISPEKIKWEEHS
ncbi:MAG: TRAP transporter small permease [Desulfotomaculales bacterium]